MSTATPMSVMLKVAKSLTLDEARRIASNIAKLPKPTRQRRLRHRLGLALPLR